ncbi:MAG: capsular biosynthesis protein CpsI [Holophagae bacterium]|nr:MAG: capsular biosynthesis protein CpsI [Holophagae bacterium]
MTGSLPTLITGVAGFIGFHLARRLLQDGQAVLGLDNLNDYYDVSLKEARLAQLRQLPRFEFVKLDLGNRLAIDSLFAGNTFHRVVHLAAQAGVRYSLVNPHAYVDSNLVGFLHILEGCRARRVPHLVYASSSSVYGANTAMPFSVHHNVDHPLSLYAATKKANELMAHTYAHLYGLPCTGLRFFTVYGPWGRPDMALFTFTRKILAGEPIEVYNYGRHRRDFTYIDDIIEGVVRVTDLIPKPDPGWNAERPNPGTSSAPWRVYNIGNSTAVELERYIEVIERCLGRTAERRLLPMQPGDVPDTFADVSALEADVGYAPSTPIETGVKNFVDWFREYYRV